MGTESTVISPFCIWFHTSKGCLSSTAQCPREEMLRCCIMGFELKQISNGRTLGFKFFYHTFWLENFNMIFKDT